MDARFIEFTKILIYKGSIVQKYVKITSMLAAKILIFDQI